MKFHHTTKNKTIVEYDGLTFIVSRKNIVKGMDMIGYIQMGKILTHLSRHSYHGTNILRALRKQKLNGKLKHYIGKLFHILTQKIKKMICKRKGCKVTLNIKDNSKYVVICSRCGKFKEFKNQQSLNNVINKGSAWN